MKCYFVDKRYDNGKIIFKTDPVTPRHMVAYHGMKKESDTKNTSKKDLKKLKIAASFFTADNGRYSMAESAGTNVFLTQWTKFVLKYKTNPIETRLIR